MSTLEQPIGLSKRLAKRLLPLAVLICCCISFGLPVTFYGIGFVALKHTATVYAHDLAMELRVNGEARQRSHSSKMSVKIPEILSHYSPMGYSAGDVVSTGTVSGVAAFSGDPKAWYLKPGDVMECEIEKIGVLRNPVISWEQAYGQKAAVLATVKNL